MKQWSRKRLGALGAAIVVIGLICGVAFHRHSNASASDNAEPQPVSVDIATVTYASIDTIVNAQGTLSPAQGESAKVASPIAGRVLDVRVREGETVSAGQVVAVIDNRPLQAQASSAAIGVEVAAAQSRSADLTATATAADQASAIRTAQLTLDAAKSDREHAVRQARIALETAQNDLKKLQAGPRPQEIAQADQAVTQAKVTRDRAATEAERVHFLYTHGIDAKRQVDDAEAALATAESALESAKQQADLLHAGARAEDVQADKLAVANAQQGLEQAQASGDAHVAQAEAALQQAKQSEKLQVAAKRQDAVAMQTTTRQKIADLQTAQATAASTILRAPLGGTVVHRLLNPGDMADPSTPVLELSNTRSLNLLANLPAEDGSKVRVGMTVRMTVPDLPGRAITGSVLSVGQIDPQTNLMTVRIAVANPDGTLKVGMFTQAAIILQTNPHAIVAPKAALVTRDGKTVVFTVGQDNHAHLRTVATGSEQGNLVEILTGVTSGEQVIRLGQYELTDGAPVKAAAKTEGAQP